jgi:hypothetical protein
MSDLIGCEIAEAHIKYFGCWPMTPIITLCGKGHNVQKATWSFVPKCLPLTALAIFHNNTNSSLTGNILPNFIKIIVKG